MTVTSTRVMDHYIAGAWVPASAATGEGTLFHKSLAQRTDFAEFPDQIAPEIDNVGAEIA